MFYERGGIIMKLTSIEDLKGNEILASPVISDNGQVLIHADTVLKEEYIEKLRQYNVREVYVRDIPEYTQEETFEASRAVVEKVFRRHIYKHNQELKQLGEEANRIINCVLSEPEVLESITEVRRISTDIYSHCINVCTMTTIMALRLKMSEKQVKSVAIGAILHDLGLRYMRLPYADVDIKDMSPADALEYKKHTIYGYSSLQEEKWLTDTAKEIILFHHERIDGKGFPFQQRADRLKPEVRLVSLCDSFDSFISGIGGKKMKIYEAIEYIRVNSGIIYDANIAVKFLESVALYPVGMEVITNEGEVGEVVRQNREATDRPVIRMLEHSDGSCYADKVEKDLMKFLTLFIVDTR